jgi:hypothetical protein
MSEGRPVLVIHEVFVSHRADTDCSCVECGGTIELGQHHFYLETVMCNGGMRSPIDRQIVCQDCVTDWMTLCGLGLADHTNPGELQNTFYTLIEKGYLELNYPLVKRWFANQEELDAWHRSRSSRHL